MTSRKIPTAVAIELLGYPALQMQAALTGATTVVDRAVIRFIVRTAIALAANAVGLLVAAALLDGVQLDAGGFIVAVVVHRRLRPDAAVPGEPAAPAGDSSAIEASR